MKNLLWGLFAFATLAHAQGTVTDIDGNTYDYLTYGTQQWTVENAAMETYRDGTPIPQVTDATQWSNLTTCSEASINASSTNICTGETVDLSIDVIGSNFSNWATGEPNNLALGTEHFGLFLSTGRWNDGPDSYTSANCIVESETNLGIVNNFTYLGVFDNHHYYLYDLTDGWNNCNNLANSLGGYLAIINSQLETNFIFNNLPSSFDRGWIGMYQDTNHPDYSEPGGAWFWVDGTPVAMSSNPSNYTWSTGDTIPNITVTPTETTEYWVDVTTNGVTCREYVTINVTAPAAPTGDGEQTFCDAATVADLTATGDNIQWYDATTGGNLLDSTTALIDSQMVYASQTVNGCESTDRLEVTVSIQDITITASATEVCAGEEVTLNVNNLNTVPASSCYGSTNQIFSDWTELAPNAEYVNIIKHNNIYYLRSNNDVLQSSNINGSWVSMNFQNQIGHQCSPIATLFDFDWADRLQVATLHNSLYAYENGNWINNGLSGYGCSGRALTRLANNRIIVSKWGYLRDLYISDDNGSNWTNVTNVDNDYRDIIVADNGTVFACGGSNTASMTGLIKSTDNGNSFFNISSELGINYASTLSDDCEGNLYVVADNSIYKSIDEGENWTLFSNTPFNSTISYSFLLPISSDVLFLFGRNTNEVGLYESNNGGATWQELTNPLSDLNTIREFKLIDNVLVILSDEGVFGKTIEFSTSTFVWSTGDTTETISVTPTETTEYWVDVTTNGVTCREYVSINVTAPAAPTGDAEQTFCEASTIADLTATGENIQWYDAATGGNLLNSTTVLTDGQMVYATQTVNGCESTERLEVSVSIQDITITASATEVCAGESVDLTVSSCTSADLPANLQTGLVGYWPFCGNANDESGNGNNGTVNGATLTTDRFGNQDSAYIFEINDSFINIGSDNLLQFSNDFSYSVKFLVNEITLGSDCTAGSNIILNNEGLYEIGVDCNGILSFAIANDDPSWSWIPITPILINQWYDVTFTYNQGVIEIFMDGDLIYNYNGSGGLTDFHPNLNDLRLGDRQLHDVLNVQTSSFNGKIDDVVLWNRALTPSEIQQLANSSTYTWSTGDTTANISVTPTETTEYWVDVTTNGVTCREFVTINVTAPAAPTGPFTQAFCDTAAVADLTATGENIQWYDAASGGNLLDSNTVLTDGQMVYASQTVNGCESTDRLEVTVSIQDITITASATEVCAGESVDLSVSSGFIACTSMELTPNLQTGLVGYWPFCGNANDESGNGNNGTVTGAILTTDRFGNANSAYNFGQNIQDYIILPPSNNYENDNISFSFWINPSQIGQTQGWNTIIKKGDFISAESEAFIFDLKPSTNGYDKFEVGYKTACEPAGYGWQKNQYDLNENLLNNWTNFVVTLDSSNNQTIYKNGALISQTLIDGNYNSCTGAEISIGSEWGQGQPLYEFYGSIDDIAIWDRVLSESEIQQLANSPTYTWSTGDTSETISVTPTETTEYWVDVTTNGVTCREYVTINVTAPAAPIGPLTQAFCDVATVADLTATGNNILWYDAATGGNLLDSITALTDGQTVYASQTVNGCESTDRLEVTVSIQDITITASATEVCAGESVDLSVVGDINSTYLWSTGESNFSGQGTLIDEYSLIANTVSQNTFSTIPGNIYRLEVSGTISLGGGAGNQRDVAYYIQSGSDGTIEGTPFDSACNLRIWTSLFCDTPGLRPSPDIYDASTHTYNYPFNANSSTLDVGFWDSPLSDNGPNVVTFKLYELSNSESTITVSPTETTEYWVDVTTNGVTCREYVTISVNDLPEAPTGESVNYFINCDSFSPTLDDAIATLTGENIKLYDAAVGGNLLDPNSNIIDGQVVYASQTLDSCESSDRLEVQLNLYTLEMPVTDAPDNTVSFCNEQNLTILDLAPAQTATDRLWYETATSTTPIAETTPLVDGVTYYVSNHDIETGCESDRLAMTVEINNPEAPTGDAVQSFCDNVTVSDLLATGSNIQWYDAATGGNVLDPSSALSDGQLLYASQTQNGCESITRLEVNVEIDIIPDPILITTELEFCLAREAALADLEVDEQGFALEWYDSFSGGNMLPMDTLLEDGVSYYATLYDAVSGCESLMRLEVVPTVIPCEVVIYNAISLNDNGMNDYMVIENAEYFPDNSLEVYNRDGHLLYSQTQYGIGGNLFRGKANVSGIYNKNSNLPTGSYLYVFKYFNPYEQQEYRLKGFLTINSN